ncbi:DUF302 domain-containing protein [Dethiobacter alkaliphilus]|uniref:DUF302 domain-containing protein n=1 Tax=Dethiobacter alkaliphilus AHT 1 TaxID=555088 RepID=C0GCF8_DETAL|nr:DUF302 domain-containing protein [Dethiobacter alkaliphilus]EEG78893.1 protein of unknown function DUF302 [Dethiobacter alkaliphilus AHT 1]
MRKDLKVFGVSALLLVFLLGFFLQAPAAFGYPAEWRGNADPFGVTEQEQQEPMQMVLENESKYDFTETVERFKQNVEDAGWSVVGVYDYKEILAEKGYDILDIEIIALCSGEYSAQILQGDHERMVSPLMPCTIAIYEKSNGNTYIARLNSGVMAAPFGGVVAEVMEAVAEETEAMVQDLIK